MKDTPKALDLVLPIVGKVAKKMEKKQVTIPSKLEDELDAKKIERYFTGEKGFTLEQLQGLNVCGIEADKKIAELSKQRK